MKLIGFLSVLFFAAILSTNTSCKHEPFIENVSTDPVDSIPNSGTPCDPGVVYFFRDVQPILLSNCAVSGCHDSATKKEGIDYSSFATTLSTGKVKPFKPNKSDLYEVLYESGDEMMPPAPRPGLTNNQKDMIKRWIAQGAKEYFCDANLGCDSTNVSYANDVLSIVTNNCTGCHSGNSPSGGVTLNDYQNISASANSGQLYGTAAHLSGFAKMPPSGNGLTTCELAQIKNWVGNGAPDN